MCNMGPNLELEERSRTVMEASDSKEDGSVVKEPERKNMRCAWNYDDSIFEGEALTQAKEVDRNEDVEVKIIEDMNAGDVALVEAEGQDATESSSSFGGSVSEVEDDGESNDVEVESHLPADATSALAFDGCGEEFRARKKKLTSHWRTFIQPLVWRCKWAELQIKKFQSLAVKYERKVEDYNQRKQFEPENFTLEDSCAKLLPFSSQCERKKIMKRKKRKRVEDAMDVASFMSHHNLFSYYENKKSAAGAAYERSSPVIYTDKATNESNGFEVNDALLSLDSRESDGSLEQLLRKIGNVQSHISIMKARLEKVMSENAGWFSSTDQLSLLVPCNASTSSAQNPASPPNNGYELPVGSSHIASRLISENKMGDLVVPESAVPINGKVMDLTTTVENTDQPQVGSLCKRTGDGILIYNQRAHEALSNSEDVKMLPVEKAQEPKKGKKRTIRRVSFTEPETPIDNQPPPKIRSISKLTGPRNKRKRGRRKAGSGKWSRRSSG